MCKSCVKEQCPDRGRVCLETGSYLVNYRSCSKCSTKDPLIIADMSSEETELTEVVTYNHTCSNCGHLVASHEYIFRVNEDCQEYEMECLLCGRGEDVVSIVPNDVKPDADIF